MFKSEISAYIQDVRRIPDPKNGTDVHVRVEFHVTPLTPDLAAEISAEIREALFRKDGAGGWIPRGIVSETDLDTTADRLRITYRAHQDLNAAATILGVAIDNVNAVRAYPDKPHLRLRFRATFQSDRDTFWDLVARYWRAKDEVLLQFEAMDPSLFESEDQTAAAEAGELAHSVICIACDSPAVDVDQEGDAYCDADRHLAPPGRELKSIAKRIADGVKLTTIERKAKKARQLHQAEGKAAPK